MAATASRKQTAPARQRLLETASEIFYREGIHSTGVERILVETGVTRATFYRHFPSKEDLVLAYLDREDELLRTRLAEASAQLGSPEQMLEALILGIADDVTRDHTRGCPFINASAEYPDPASPVRRTVKRHRDWFRATLRGVLDAAERDDSEQRAGALVLLRDAALVGGYLDGPDTIRETFIRTARRVAGLE